MIKTKNGEVHITGFVWELVADLGCITKALKESGVSEEDINEAVKYGLMTEEELKNL